MGVFIERVVKNGNSNNHNMREIIIVVWQSTRIYMYTFVCSNMVLHHGYHYLVTVKSDDSYKMSLVVAYTNKLSSPPPPPTWGGLPRFALPLEIHQVSNTRTVTT